MTSSSLTKICTQCGEEKPLSAFFILTHASSNQFSSICASCRQKSKNKKPIKESDERTASTSGLKIDAKAKIHLDSEKEQAIKKQEHDEYKEKTKEEDDSIRHLEKKHTKQKNERKHREDFLKKQHFISQNEKNTKKVTSKEVIGSEEQMAKEREFDFNAPFIDTQFAGKLKTQSAIFNQFKSWIGESAPIAQRLEKNAQKTSPTQEPKDKQKTESLTEYVDRTWGPKSSR